MTPASVKERTAAAWDRVQQRGFDARGAFFWLFGALEGQALTGESASPELLTETLERAVDRHGASPVSSEGRP